MTDFRTESDSLGPKQLTRETVWGIHTARALENFPITGVPLAHFPELVQALAMVKKAAALANRELGALDAARAAAIASTCDEIIAGRHHEHFVVDMIQGGAGTSTNMNANEVIANLALQGLGHAPGDYAQLHPNDHVNRSQSTNDVYPTAIRLAVLEACAPLRAEQQRLADAFAERARAFAPVIKVGRTQLQDAVPMTLGMEFAGFAATIEEDIARLGELAALLREVNLGGTAIGTGVTTPAGYAALAVRHLAAISGEPLVEARDRIEASSDLGAFVTVSGVLKRIAVKLSKICNDLRLLSSGPRAGLGEIRLPPMQAGSSIMPGKVNPVIPEVVNQVAYQVIGNDLTVTLAAEAGPAAAQRHGAGADLQRAAVDPHADPRHGGADRPLRQRDRGRHRPLRGADGEQPGARHRAGAARGLRGGGGDRQAGARYRSHHRRHRAGERQPDPGAVGPRAAGGGDARPGHRARCRRGTGAVSMIAVLQHPPPTDGKGSRHKSHRPRQRRHRRDERLVSGPAGP